MKNVTLNIGGQLTPGDVVGIAYANCIVFAWYVEEGQYGSLKYLSFNEPVRVLNQYKLYQNGTHTGAFWDKRFAKGLVFKNFKKEYIISFDHENNRAFKIGNPEEFFKDSKTETPYLQAREILRNLNFPAK